jgi:uracil-DNA glycosylase
VIKRLDIFQVLPNTGTLENLHTQAKQCRLCPTSQNMGKCALYRGYREASVLVLSEKSGVNEAREGKPFAGKAGQLLSELMTQAGLTPWRDVRATNLVICPPGDRQPTVIEVKNCTWWRRFIALHPPKLILALGELPIRTLKNSPAATISNVNGHSFTWQGFNVIGSYNPAFLLRVKRDHPSAYNRSAEPWTSSIKDAIATLKQEGNLPMGEDE